MPLWLYGDTTPADLRNAPYAAFMLGSVYNAEICKQRGPELRTLLTLLTQQDIAAFTGKAVKETAGLTIWASVVAYNLKEPLTVIANTCNALERELHSRYSEPNTLIDLVANIDVQRLTVTRRVDNLLTLMRGPRIAPALYLKSTSIRELIDLAFSEMNFPESVSIVVDVPNTLPLVYVDVDETVRIFTNLIENALDSMAEGGILTISAQWQRNKVKIRFSDTGKGISVSQLPQVFDPFFTTKEMGTGLGLTASKLVVEAQGGTIDIESSVGQGTSVILSLPVEEEGNPHI